MNQYIDLRGASGALYRYTLAENAKPRSPVSGTFVYVRDGQPEPAVLYAGETNNLADGAPELWPVAVKTHGATHLFTRLNVASAAREKELEDLFAVEVPPMNGAPPA